MSEPDDVNVTAAQVRAARALLGWSQEQLAAAARVGRATVARYETEARDSIPTVRRALRQALERAGIDFIPEDGGGAGVRLRDRSARGSG